MSKNYNISGEILDGQYYTLPMVGSFSECELSSIIFKNAAGEQVQPTAGTVRFEGTAEGAVWRNIQGGSFNATDCYDPDRAPPFATGLCVNARLTLNGVVGATTFTAIVWRNE